LRLNSEDRNSLNEIFKSQGVEKGLKLHLDAALHDAFVILTLPKTAVRHYQQFKFVASGTRSAYNLYCIEKTTQYFLQAMTSLVVQNPDSDLSLTLGLIFYYLNQSADNESKRDDSKTSHLLFNHIRLRISMV
jgi:hypothetical protein